MKFPLKRLFDAFTNGSLDIGRLNFGTITLLPKCEDALVIQKYRPICLMNESLKIITKGVNNRLNGVVDDLIDKTQTAFMKNRFIMEGWWFYMRFYMRLRRRGCLVCFSKWTLKKHMTM
jgi:hypothetical protein